MSKKKTIIVETSDWTIIPLENMIAKFRTAGTEILAVASRKEEAELYLTTMEKGVDGVVIQTDDPLQIGKFKNLLVTSEPVELSEVEGTLLPYHFARPGESYLVNLRHLRAIEGNEILVGEDRLPLSRRRKTEFVSAFTRFLGGF